MQMWFKLISRRVSVQGAMAWNQGLSGLLREKYGVGLNDFLVFWDGKKTDYCVDSGEWEELQKGVFRLLEDDRFITTCSWRAQEFLENLLQEVKTTLDCDLARPSNEELRVLYERLLEKHNAWLTRQWITHEYLSSAPIAKIVRLELSKKIKDESRVEDLMRDFSSPLVMNDVLNERWDALELAIEKPNLSEPEFEEKLRKHAENYEHISMFDVDHEPLTLEHFRNELLKIKNPLEEKEKMSELFSQREKKFGEQLQNLNLTPDSRQFKLVQALKHAVFLKDHRAMLRQKLNLSLRKLYLEIARRLGTRVERATLLSNQEIIDFLNGETRAEKLCGEAEKRGAAFLLIQNRDGVSILAGAEAIEKAKKELETPDAACVAELKGVIASKGVARGPARIIHTDLDLNKIEEGDIMVTHMTRPKYVPFMRKCKGFVTDEGGITCHTAIVAREFGLPCIVGTKTGTSVFKDGELVELNADQGVARKLASTP